MLATAPARRRALARLSCSRAKAGGFGSRRGNVITRYALGVCFVSVVIRVGMAAQEPRRAPDMYFAPTWEPVVYEMLTLAGVTRNDVVVDLGSGDGRIVILAAQQYGARGIGIEIDPKLVAISRRVARDAEVDDKVTFVQGDLFTADISTARVVTLYLSESINRELEPKLRRELRPGTRIVSHQFRIGTWPPDRVIRSAVDQTDLMLWTVPPR